MDLWRADLTLHGAARDDPLFGAFEVFQKSISNTPNEFISEAKAGSLNWCKTMKTKGTLQAKENAWFVHTQEVRGSSPCAPTIIFRNLRGRRVPQESTFGYTTSCFSVNFAECSKSRGTLP